ncbi:MAG: glycosyltransferase family 4 protein [Gemmatimonadota bacterium]
MRVVHIVTAYPRSPADPITPWLVELLRRQRAAGVEASVLTPAYRGGPADQVPTGLVHGVPVHRFRYAPARWETLTHDETVPDRLRRAPRFAALVPAYLLTGVRAARSWGRHAPDVVHVHWPVPHALLGAALRSGSGGRTAMVCSYYSVELNWVNRRLPWLRPFARWTIRTADAVTAISTSTARLVRRLGSREASVIPFAAALADDGIAPSRPALSGGGPLRLLFVGRLVERKGVEVLVRAMPLLPEDRDARLTIVGEGEWEERIRAAVSALGLEKRVELTGRISGEELARRYEEADIFVLPAVVDTKGDTEGLGVVLLEALRFERPVVASAVGGIPDIVEPGRSGWLVPPGDPKALASTLEEIAAEPEGARRVAREGRRMGRERFSWEGILEATRRCYEEAIRRRRGR